MLQAIRGSGAIRRSVAAGLMLAVLAGIAMAHAQVGARGHDERARREHARPIRHRPPPRPDWGYDAPSYVASPPPIVYAPPAPPAALTLGLTLNLQ